jgi:hypothetical protein
MEVQTEGWKDRQTDMADLGMEGQTDRSREVWRYKQKDGGTDRQTDRQTEWGMRFRHTYREKWDTDYRLCLIAAFR